jgi:hypothetical protein
MIDFPALDLTLADHPTTEMLTPLSPSTHPPRFLPALRVAAGKIVQPVADRGS